MEALQPSQKARPMKLRIGQSTLPIVIHSSISPLDSSLEETTLCNCHGQPVVKASELHKLSGVHCFSLDDLQPASHAVPATSGMHLHTVAQYC